jgi:formylglycine-generating enzyme required for sulfatase activity
MRYYPEMVWVEGGTFTMGCDTTRGDGDCYDHELPPHTVNLSDFRIARTETTVWQFYIYCENDSINIRNFAPGWGLSGDNPMADVTWYQATQYANWLSNRLPGFKPAYCFDEEGNFIEIDSISGPAFRLPTEAQWEYAARGGKRDVPSLFAGSDNLDEVGWYRENSEIDGVRQTHQVGAKKANELGLYDMSGNVWEWCQDWYGESYYEDCKNLGPVVNPEGAENTEIRVLRGGSWSSSLRNSRVSDRGRYYPGSRDDYGGFRLSQD